MLPVDFSGTVRPSVAGVPDPFGAHVQARTAARPGRLFADEPTHIFSHDFNTDGEFRTGEAPRCPGWNYLLPIATLPDFRGLSPFVRWRQPGLWKRTPPPLLVQGLLAASKALHPRARRIHLDMAGRYADLVQAIDPGALTADEDQVQTPERAGIWF